MHPSISHVIKTAVQAWPIFGYVLIAVAVVSLVFVLSMRKGGKAQSVQEQANEARDEGLGNK